MKILHLRGLNFNIFDLQVLKELTAAVTLPMGLEKRVKTCLFATDTEMQDAAIIADELYACLQRLKYAISFIPIFVLLN